MPPSSQNQRQPPPSPARRKSVRSVEDTVKENDSIQRLVEYFVVVSSHPRWEVPAPPPPPPSTQTSAAGPMPPSPNLGAGGASPIRQRRRRGRVATAAAATPKTGLRKTAGEVNGSGNIQVKNDHGDGGVMGTREFSFQPRITARYPERDYAESPLNPMITQFCYPHSDCIVPSAEYIMPRVHHFVLTNDKGRKLYGTCLTVYEEYSPSANDPFRRGVLVHYADGSDQNQVEITVDKDARSLYLPKVLCLLSYWPYLSGFREYVTQLYRQATTTKTMKTPIERYIVNICKEIPCPPPGAFEVQMRMLDSTIKFWAPPAKLPVAYVSLPYRSMFDCLDINNVLLVWYALVMEQKVVLLSSQYSLLTICAETLCSLLFPMQWSHLYIPLLPKFLSPMLDAPIPYLVGVIQDNWGYTREHISDEAIVVDLDNNKVSIGQMTPKLSTPPAKKWTKLQVALEQGAGEVFWATRGLETEYNLFMKGKITRYSFEKMVERTGNVAWREQLNKFDDAFSMAYTPDSPNLLREGDEDMLEASQWDKVQEAFLNFFVSALKSYKKFLHMSTPGMEEEDEGRSHSKWNRSRTFDMNGFIAWQKVENQPFYREFCGTQMFDDFITKRLYSPGEPYVIFFDQSIDAKMNRSRLKVKKLDTTFLQNAKAHKVLNTIDAVDPNEDGLPEDAPSQNGSYGHFYSYRTWPESFDRALFSAPRPTSKMITAEFDRQAYLVRKLRATRSEQEDADVEDIFLGGEYEPSPEVATFTLHLFTYGALIGLEFQEYQKALAQADGDGEVPDEVIPPPPPPPTLQTSLQSACGNGEGEGFPKGALAEEKKDDDDGLNESRLARTQSVTSLQPSGWAACAETEVHELGNELGMLKSEMFSIDCFKVCPDFGRTQTLLTRDQDTIPMTFTPWGLGSRGAPALEQQKQQAVQDGENNFVDFADTLAEYEEARAVAAAQLDLAFDVLKTIGLRRLVTDSDSYKSLMDACGRCGDTERAVQLMGMMKRDGFVADREIYACFTKSFAAEDGIEGAHKLSRRGSDAYTLYLKKKATEATRALSVVSSGTATTGLEDYDDSASDYSDFSDTDSAGNKKKKSDDFVTGFYNSFFSSTPQKKKKRRKRKPFQRKSKPMARKAGMMVTTSVLKQVDLGENLLQYLYPDLVIDTNSEACPLCSFVLSEGDIVNGWMPCKFQELTTKCPQCQHRFVPKFSVVSSSPTFEGSQGPSTPLYCEFLSPWVLRKELDKVIRGSTGVEGMLQPAWRAGHDIQAALWWNQVVLYNRYRLPVSFLLQGSFQNRLINPTPDAGI